jgi:hypothetical protein
MISVVAETVLSIPSWRNSDSFCGLLIRATAR